MAGGADPSPAWHLLVRAERSGLCSFRAWTFACRRPEVEHRQSNKAALLAALLSFHYPTVRLRHFLCWFRAGRSKKALRPLPNDRRPRRGIAQRLADRVHLVIMPAARKRHHLAATGRQPWRIPRHQDLLGLEPRRLVTIGTAGLWADSPASVALFWDPARQSRYPGQNLPSPGTEQGCPLDRRGDRRGMREALA